MPRERALWIAAAIAAVAIVACATSATLESGGGGDRPPDAGSEAVVVVSGGEDASASVPGLFSDASFGGRGAADGDAAPLCAEDVEAAERVPLDLVLLIDRSASMQGLKWEMLTKALTSFVGDPRSAGLGVGLQFFPP